MSNFENKRMKNDRSWVEISFDRLKKNLMFLKTQISDTQRIMAVVKADAYGHGDAQVAGFLQEQGITEFAVSNIDEAIRLRDSGIIGQILVLGYTAAERAKELLDYDITQALLSEEYANVLSVEGLPIKCQFAIDTGMNRVGLNAKNLPACEKTIRKYSDLLPLNGIFTHLCAADTPEEDVFTEQQVELFKALQRRIDDLHLPYCHFLNSAGGLWHKDDNSAMVRFGIVLYGLKPDYDNTLSEELKPVLSWKTVVSMVKEVGAGETIGYGRTFHTEDLLRIATVPTGYADGYPRILSNRGHALVNGRSAPIVGRICMDQMMIDVTGIPDVQMGTEVVLIGESGDRRITADDVAKNADTIGYEIVCGISKRVPRLFIL